MCEEPTYTNTEQTPEPSDKADRLDPNNKLYSIPQKHNDSSNKQISKDIDKIKTLSLNRPPPQGPQAFQSGLFLGEDSIHRLSSFNRNNSLNPFLREGIFLEDMYENAPNISSRPLNDQSVVQTDKRTDEQTDRQAEKQQISEELSDSETSTFSTSSYTYTSSSNNLNSSEQSASRSNFDSKDTNDSKLNRF